MKRSAEEEEAAASLPAKAARVEAEACGLPSSALARAHSISLEGDLTDAQVVASLADVGGPQLDGLAVKTTSTLGAVAAKALGAAFANVLDVSEAAMRYGPIPPGRDCHLGVVITLKGAKPADLELSQVRSAPRSAASAPACCFGKSRVLTFDAVLLLALCLSHLQLSLHLEGDKLWEALPVALAWVIQKSFMPLELAPGMVDLRAAFPRGAEAYCAEIGIGTKQNGTIGVRDFKIRSAVEMLVEGGDHPFTCRLVADDSDKTLLQITARPSSYLRALADNTDEGSCFIRNGREVTSSS